MRRYIRSKAQALVEFALAATLIFFLLAAAVDLGLIFLNLQTLRTAAQEGAVFGSYPQVRTNPSTGMNEITLNFNEIRNRVRLSTGPNPIGFTNLLDLNGNGTPDVQGNNFETTTQIFDTHNGERLPFDPNNGSERNRVTNQYITVQVIRANDNGTLPGGVVTNNDQLCHTQPKMMSYDLEQCYIRVIVRYNYRLIFPLAPAFANEVILPASYTLRLRTNFLQ